ncbi:MAG: hypothetical protein LBI18_07125 [Planctomycetaceae bacterium]|nr:hypothetical protein [Planctomycetaceae bacterium]
MFALLAGLAILFLPYYIFALIVLFISAVILRFYRLIPLAKTSVSHFTLNLFETTDSWAKHFGFHYIGSFGSKCENRAIWENPELSTILSISLDNQQSYYYFHTIFDENIRLETNNQKIPILTLPPEHYIQVFSSNNLDELWRKHLESKSWLEKYENVRLIPYHPDFAWGNIDAESSKTKRDGLAAQTILVNFARTQGKYLLGSLRQFLLLPLTIIYRWFFWHGKSVQLLVEQERLQAPDQLPENRQKYSVNLPSVRVNSTQLNQLPKYCVSDLPVPYKRGIMGKLMPLVFTIIGFGMMGFLMFYAIYVPEATEETQILQKQFREHLFDFEYDKAIETANTISQPYWREEAYFHIAQQQAETGQFDACRDMLKNIVGKCHRHHPPPIRWIIKRHLISALAADDRFDEAEKILYDNKSIFYGEELPVCRYYLAAGMPDKSLTLLKNSKKSDSYYEVLRDTVAKLTQMGEFEKALETAKNMELDGWQHSAYREIIRESLIRNEVENARKVFDNYFKLFRYRQQAAALFMIWHLERDEVEKAWRLYEEHLVDQSENNRINRENNNEPKNFHDDWKRQHAIGQKLPYDHNHWRLIAQRIFLRFGREKEAQKIGDLISHPNAQLNENFIATSLPPKLDPTTNMSNQEILEKQIAENLLAIQRNSDDRLFRQMQLVSLNHKLGKFDEALKSLEEYRNELRTMQLPNPFYPKYQQKTRKQHLHALFDAELLLKRFDEAEKTIQLFGITNTADVAILHIKLAALFREAGQDSKVKEHILLAWKFARRINSDLPIKYDDYFEYDKNWSQVMPEIIVLPDLLEQCGFSEQAKEARNRFMFPPLRLRLLRFQQENQFTFPDMPSSKKQ